MFLQAEQLKNKAGLMKNKKTKLKTDMNKAI